MSERLTIDQWPADRPLPEPGSADYPLHSELTIGAYLRMQTAIDPDHEFVVYPDRALRWTYRDFDQRTDELAKGLLAIGMEPGDHLGVWARNIPDWLTFMYATSKIGVVMVTVNPVYKSHELDYVLKQSDMKALCVIDAYRDVDYLQIIRRARARDAHPGARPPGVRELPLPQVHHLHGSREAPRLL